MRKVFLSRRRLLLPFVLLLVFGLTSFSIEFLLVSSGRSIFSLKNYFFRRIFDETDRIEIESFRFQIEPDRSNPKKSLLQIYEQQVTRLNKTPILPVFEDSILKIRFHVKLIGKFFWTKTNFHGDQRTFRFVSDRISSNLSKAETLFEILLRFRFEQTDDRSIKLLFESASFDDRILAVKYFPSSQLVEQILFETRKTHSNEQIFSFSHRWADQKKGSTLFWPQWPIFRPCAQQILDSILSNKSHPSRIHLFCTSSRLLFHSNVDDNLRKERTATGQWLDIQYESNSFVTNEKFRDQWLLRQNGRRSTPAEIAATRSLCPIQFHSWIQYYRAWHRNQTSFINEPNTDFQQRQNRIFDRNLRFIVYEKGNSSDADSLIQLITTYLIGLLTNRILIVSQPWPELSQTIRSTINLQQDQIVPWFSTFDRLEQDNSRQNIRYLSFKRYNFISDKNFAVHDYDREFPERILFFQGHQGSTVHLTAFNSSFYHSFLVNRLKMNPNKLFGCLFHSLFVYRLSSLIEFAASHKSSKSFEENRFVRRPGELIQILLSAKFHSMGVEIQRGETELGSSSETFLRCAENILSTNQIDHRDKDQTPIQFLLTDSAVLHSDFLRAERFSEFCSNVSSTSCPASNNRTIVVSIDRSTSSFRNDLLEIFLFSLCQEHVITKKSSIGRIAVFISLKEKNVFSLSVNSTERCLSSNESLSLTQEALQTGGI